MHVYIRNQEGTALIEKGKILSVGGTGGKYLLTGDDELVMTSIGKYKNKKRAEEILNEIIQRTMQPTAREAEKNIIFIDLKGIE